MQEKPCKTQKPQSSDSRRSGAIAEKVDAGLLYEIKKERPIKER